MLTPKFDLDTLASDEDLVACIVPAGDLFALMSRSVTVPMGWSALVARQGRDPRVVKAGGCCEESGTLDVLFVRSTPIACAADASGLRSADGFDCHGSVRVPLRIMAETTELAAFRNDVLGSSDSLSVADLQRHFHWQMSRMLSDLAGRLSAGELLQPLDAATVRTVAENALGAACLAGGLTIDGPVAVHFDSPAYHDHCRHQAGAEREQRRLAARAEIQRSLATARDEQLTHLVRMLERMNEASAKHEDVNVADLLRAFSEAERGELYAALWQLCPGARRTRFVAAVSGPQLLLFEPAQLDRPARRIELPEDLGLLRSVSSDPRSLDAGLLLVGAARGVHLVDIESGKPVRSLRADAAEHDGSRGGVNAAAMSHDRVFASHSQLGLMTWLREPAGDEASRALLADLTHGTSTVRCARVAESRLWFAVDQSLYALPVEDVDTATPTRYAASSSTISSLAVAGDQVYAGNVDGQIIAWDVDDPDKAHIVRGAGGGPVESIDVIATGGVSRLVIADRSRALMLMVVGDNFTCRYESPSQIVRRGAAAEDLFVAMNDTRDRLLAWDPREPKQPSAVVIIPHLTGSTIQDICLVPSTSCPTPDEAHSER